LITETPDAYEALVRDLMTDRARCAALKAKVDELRATAPLFATDDFARHFETALRAVHARAVEGLDPKDIRVSSL
jgi:predicted O-linked N-acetylglucosamine transferase (SPINDLY family)